MRPPFAPAVLATLLVVAAEAMLFAGLVFAFWALRLAAPVWPPPLQHRLPVGLTALATLALLASSVAVAAAARALRAAEHRALRRRLAAGAALGGLFLAVQGWEWARLVGVGFTVGSGLYGALFYTLIGTHALHVLVALGWLAGTLVLVRGDRLVSGRASAVHACALYWHFVVALWPLLYVSVYVL
jgi:heme/copper-type cytochrome/quinol oxidase subunit 3